MATTHIDIDLCYSETPSGCGESLGLDWWNIELSDDNLNPALDELAALVNAWIQRQAVNKKDFKEQA